MADLYDKITTDSDLKRVKEAQSIGMYPYFRALSDTEGVTATIDGKEVVMHADALDP